MFLARGKLACRRFAAQSSEVAPGVPSRYIPNLLTVESPMRAEVQNVVAEIKQSVGLLRRSL
jgi:hypothetical protein